MTLVATRLASNPRLQSAARNAPPIKKGERGVAVSILQQAFLDIGLPMPITTGNGTRPPDGIYGDETVKTVWTFQKREGLSNDGIAGHDTLHRLDALLQMPVVRDDGCACGNCFGLNLPAMATVRTADDALSKFAKFDLGNNGKGSRFGFNGAKSKSFLEDKLAQAQAALTNLKNQAVAAATSAASAVGSKLQPVLQMQIPTTATPLATWLTGAGSGHKKNIDDVFGTSIDPSNIVVTDGLGISGRAFVLWMPRKAVVGTPMTRPNQGVLFVNWGTTPDADKVIHELTHCWQSQHATIQGQYMVNAVKSQDEASKNGGSAYAWQDSPRKLFREYAAEQIAQQCQKNVAVIRTHIRSVAAWAVDADNDASLSTARWAKIGDPGVKS